jgi:hypothetical protein
VLFRGFRFGLAMSCPTILSVDWLRANLRDSIVRHLVVPQIGTAGARVSPQRMRAQRRE